MPDKENYRLVEWTPELADDLIAVMAAYPHTTDYACCTISQSSYYSTFQYAAIVEREAMLRFPTDPRVNRWRMGEATHLAYGEGQVGGELYRKILVEALNSEEVTLDEKDLNRWLHIYPNDLTISLRELPTLPGYASSHVVNISGNGGMSFWLLQQRDGYVSYPLYNDLGNSYSIDYNLYYNDLTGDGILDLVIYLGIINGSDRGGIFSIYDLGTVPPVKLTLGPQPNWLVDAGLTNSVIIKQSQDGTKRLIAVEEPDAKYECFIFTSNTFKWNGQWFDLVDVGITLWSDKDYSCIYMLKRSHNSPIEQRALIKFYETTFGDTKPTGENYETGADFLPDAQDEFRYRLAIQYALLGERSETIAYLSKIIDNPSVPESYWIKPAQEFMQIYQTPEDIYKVCLQSKTECNKHQAIELVARGLPVGDFTTLVQYMKDHGVPVRSSGLIDIDNDDAHEQWMVVYDASKHKLEYWLVARALETVEAVFVGNVTTLSPEISTYTTNEVSGYYGLFTPENSYRIITVSTAGTFAFVRRKVDQKLFVAPLEKSEVSIPDPAQVRFNAIVEGLWAGNDPKQVVEELLSLRNLPDYITGSAYPYYLGLSYELSGDAGKAVEYYLKAWQNCCRISFFYITMGLPIADPYAILAQAKLELIP